MALISLQDITLAYGGPPLFDHMDLQLEPGERVALLGRNGAGKTTLMKVMAGTLKTDSGLVVYQRGIRVTHLPQEVPAGISGNVFDLVLSGLGDRVKLLSDYHHVSHRLQTEYSEQLMKQLGDLQSEMDHTQAWEMNREVEEVIARVKLDPESQFEKLSGGQKKRALLARALVLKPEVLLLDEPTNHLDIEAIEWLEAFLKGYSGTLFFVTHDRTFMTHLATRIVELDRGRIFSWACDYPTFLERKQMALDAEEAERARFEKKLEQEEIWIRQGIKARRTRNQGRVVALQRLREKKRAERRAMGTVKMKAQALASSGHLVARVHHVTHGYNGKILIRDFTTKIMRGDKIGVIGPNGCGKTTLLRLLLGQIEPQKGTLHLGTGLQVAYYDQLREQLDEEQTVAKNVCESGDTVMVNGKPRNIIGYLQDFLFSPDRARTPVKVLSGGERNRLFLAKLFTKPANLLVMDEPTNDLDVETLELLEELLVEYPGTVLLVSHDRSFLNNVVTSTMAIEADGVVREYPGGYDDWLSQRVVRPAAGASKTPVASKGSGVQASPVSPAFSAKEQRELATLLKKIEAAEAEQEKLYQRMAEPGFYQKDPQEISRVQLQAEALSAGLAQMYERWEALEKLKKT
ncbi:MAG TPA: ATP-binding cassette domain-containing protein [Candidatus Omnitrophota bacterium]|nr:ATP-binding cassette domain-containing protein [Candidatus Omnitrophota bacterium]HPS36567.1 ATP-binding cassette domain-containing protein [Candidatus Omnitrophota bacterium]